MSDDNPPQKRMRVGEATVCIPTFTSEECNRPGFDDGIQTAFEAHQVVYLPSFTRNTTKKNHGDTSFTWKDVGDVYHSLTSDKDIQSLCIENKGTVESDSEEILQPTAFFDPNVLVKNADRDMVAYCSFLVQDDQDVYEKLIPRLPVRAVDLFQSSSPPSLSSPKATCGVWEYEPCVWMFFGHNTSTQELQGRPEHTDSISHSGTWHFQLSGAKQWKIRPTCKLLELWKQSGHGQSWTESSSIDVECNEGDLLIINTRLWKHQTILPGNQTNPSVSYARDFWTSRKPNVPGAVIGGMSNVDGLYANEDIEEGTIVFQESEMPDCELHRSNVNPNCYVVELESGSMAVVSTRSIACGEFFCIPESSDEEDSSSDDDDDDQVSRRG